MVERLGEMRKWRRERIEIERWRQKGSEINFEEEEEEHQYLPLLVIQLPQGTAFLLSSRLDSAVKSGLVKGLSRRD